MKFFLITSDHLSDRLWFKDTEDFIVAMNYVALEDLNTPRRQVSLTASDTCCPPDERNFSYICKLIGT